MKKLFALLLLIGFSLTASAVEVTAGRTLPDFTELVEKQGPAVVNISTTQTLKGRPNLGLPFDEDDPAFEIFRRFFPGVPGGRGGVVPQPQERESHSLGSGFILSNDGYVLTNAHVVDGADEVKVKLTDKREFKAKIVGTDKRTDVALLKIDASGLPTVKIGDSSALKVGEWVVAIGSPFGFENSVTAGIVSAKGRDLPQENYVPFIQTDVAINPGNSGGPLFNMKGEVVGINSQIYSRSGGFMGLSFAIPMEVALDVQNQLKAHGKVSRGRIGVVAQELNKDLAESFGLTKATGALISAVEPGSPAEKGGIEKGDVILKFDGKTINAFADLSRYVGSTHPGTKVPVEIWRGNSSRQVQVTVGEMPEEKGAVTRPGSRRATPEQAANRLGLVVSELSSDQKRELKVQNGLVIEDVRGNAAKADLRPGDVILSLVSKGIATDLKSVDQLNKLLAQLDKSSNVTLLIWRGGSQVYVTVRGLNG